MNFLNFKKEKNVSLESLHPTIFNTRAFWFVSLTIFVMVCGFLIGVGLKFCYEQYFETYAKSDSIENYEDLINFTKLNKAINKRQTFVNTELILPRDPSLW